MKKLEHEPKDKPMTAAGTARLVRQFQDGKISAAVFWLKVCGQSPARKGA